MATGWVCHELYMWHNTWNWPLIFPPSLTLQPGVHAENPETKRRFRNLIEVSGLIDHLVQIKPRSATLDEVARVQDFLASGAKGEPAKDGRPPGRGLRISGGLGGSTGYQESLHIRKMGSLDRP
jgi:hypothetical protein